MVDEALKLRRIRGGVGTIETKCITEFEVKDLEVGDTELGIKVPKGCIVIAATIKNGKDDLAGAGNIGLKLGDETILTPAAIAEIKGTAVGGCFSEGYAADTEEEVKLTTTGALTKGKLDICVLYM